MKKRMRVAEMRMLRWMRGVTKDDRIKHEYLKDGAEVTSTVDKSLKNRHI